MSYLVANPEDRFSCDKAHKSHVMRKCDFKGVLKVKAKVF